MAAETAKIVYLTVTSENDSNRKILPKTISTAIIHKPSNEYETTDQTTVSAELDKLASQLKGKDIPELTDLSQNEGKISLTVGDVTKTLNLCPSLLRYNNELYGSGYDPLLNDDGSAADSAAISWTSLHQTFAIPMLRLSSVDNTTTIDKTTSNYLIFSSSLIVQWGTYIGLMQDDDKVDIVFPVSYTRHSSVFVSAFDRDNDGLKSLFTMGKNGENQTDYGVYKTGFRACNTQNNIMGFNWLAIGI